MQLVRRQFPGFLMLVQMNADRLFAIGTVVVGLLSGAFLGSALLGMQ